MTTLRNLLPGLVLALSIVAGVTAASGIDAPAYAQGDDFVDDWFDSSIRSGGTSYRGEQRGYVTGGSFSGRFRMSNDNLFTVSPPRVGASCGGIDLFAGGISYLDPEYLVQKFENILQAAPAVAFNMALKHICEPCESTIVTLENIANRINGLAINDCAAANRVVRLASSPETVGDEMKTMISDLRLELGLSKNPKHVQDETEAAGYTPPPGTNLRSMIDACPTRVKDLLTSGSLVNVAASNAGLGDYADLIRGLVGDVTTTWDPATPDVPPEYGSIGPCPDNEPGDLTALVRGGVFMRDASGICSQNNALRLDERVASNLVSIGNKFGTGTAFTVEEAAFMREMSALMVHSMLREAKKHGTVDEVVEQTTPLIATAYGYQIIRDLLNETEFMLAMADRDISTIGIDPAAVGTQKCDVTLLLDAVVGLAEMRENVRVAEETLKLDLVAMQTEFQSVIEYQKAIRSTVDFGLVQDANGTMED